MRHILVVLILISPLAGSALAQVEPRLPDHRQFAQPAASSSPTDSASPAPRPYKPGSNLYDFVLHQLNPTDFDWGAWYEARRRALLEATAYNPDFWYCFMATVIAVVLFAALLKSMYDHKRKVHIMGEQMDQVRRHHAYSHRVAEEVMPVVSRASLKAKAAIRCVAPGLQWRPYRERSLLDLPTYK